MSNPRHLFVLLGILAQALTWESYPSMLVITVLWALSVSTFHRHFKVTLATEGIDVDFLDLSRLQSDSALRIDPCKACVSPAQPLCHWPCSCYPNHAFNQVNDWMAEIYERWVLAHGVILAVATDQLSRKGAR